jgi:hypothetical protein
MIMLGLQELKLALIVIVFKLRIIIILLPNLKFYLILNLQLIFSLSKTIVGKILGRYNCRKTNCYNYKNILWQWKGSIRVLRKVSKFELRLLAT